MGYLHDCWEVCDRMDCMAVDSKHVYLGCANLSYVTVYSHRGATMRTLPLRDKLPLDFTKILNFSPSGLAVMNDFLYIYDNTHDGRILIINTVSGRHVQTWSEDVIRQEPKKRLKLFAARGRLLLIQCPH